MRCGTALLLLCCAGLASRAAAQTLADELTWQGLPAPEPTVQEEKVYPFSIRAEYLYWYLRRLEVPPLLTTGPVGSAAVLGEPGTTILRGGDGLNSRHDRYIGVRARGDYWVPGSRTLGLQVDCF